jgi:hypothetical protein
MHDNRETGMSANPEPLNHLEFPPPLVDSSHHPMNAVIPKTPKRAPWKLAAELFFVAWVIVINLLYYAQFKDLALRQLGRFLHR